MICRLPSSFFSLSVVIVTLLVQVEQSSAQTTFDVFQGQSIQNVINGASSGDTILVHPGVYSENLNFGGRELALRSVGGSNVTSIAVNGGVGVRLSGASELVGFTISGASAAFGAGVDVGGVGTLIQGNIFENNTQTAGGFGAAIGGNGASPIINQNIFRNNSSDFQFTSGVVAFVNSSSPLITNNIFHGNDSRGVNLTLPQGTNPRVINNTFFDNEVAIRVDRRIETENQEFRNNIVVENEIGLEIDFGSEALNPTWENNLVFDNGIDYETILNQAGINGNIALDPLFVDPLNGDFRLLFGSSAIDTGSFLDAPLLDFANNLRPFDGDGLNGAQFDIGAFEFVAVPEPSIAFALLAMLPIVSRRSRT